MAFDTGVDFNGTPIKIGDRVAFIAPHVKSLATGTVTGFTAMKIEVEWTSTVWRDNGKVVKILRDINWVIKLPESGSVEDRNELG